MGRPSKSEERREQILDAFERIILRDGYAKASQRKIAEEADLNQPMIHHYFSGQNELLDAFLARIISRYSQALNEFVQSNEAPSLEQVISFVCSDDFHKISRQNEVFFCLIGQGGFGDEMFQKLSSVYHRFLQEIICHLEQANIANAEHLAYMIMCFVIGHDWAKKLGFGEHRNEKVAHDLLSLAKLSCTES
ncbi:hypothetical protein GCM10007876_12110 [Litoribrevibacter albus]|uniref:HTH tetR-type domain-containing protein n=2 Tax=Litoribrevibacter albus TaxID=1473156 RepID=A0AA37W538_9GAMM|nr:hypothetical protein GCM10007876_12110 [Litoribrevibacter albus]